MNFLKKAVSKVKSAVQKVGSFLSSGKNTATAVSGLPTGSPNLRPQVASNLNQIARQLTPTSSGSGGVTKPGALGTLSSAPAFTLSGGATPNYRPGADYVSPIYSAPVTISGGGSRTSGTTSTDTSRLLSAMGSTSLSSGSISSSSFSPSGGAITLPSAPSVANPGVINNGGLVGLLAGDSQYDPNSNQFLPKDAQVDAELQGRMTVEKMLQEMIPRKESIYEDAEVQRQQEEVNRRKQEVANYTAQLNSVVAQQNADLLRLREIGSKEGVTETVYGGQAATINREAAIKALPIQAQIAAAQGNLELAQDYLTQLSTWKQEQLDLDYTYRKDVYNSIRGFVDKEEARQLAKQEKADDRAYTESRALVQEQYKLALEASENGQAYLIPRINNTTSLQELANVAGAIQQKSTSKASERLTSTEVAQFQYDYPDAGIKMGDTWADVDRKTGRTNTPGGTNTNTKANTKLDDAISALNALNASGVYVEEARKKVPEGKIGVVEKATGTIGSIFPEEFDPSLYVRF